MSPRCSSRECWQPDPPDCCPSDSGTTQFHSSAGENWRTCLSWWKLKKNVKTRITIFFGDKRLQIAFHFFKTSAPAWAGHYLAHNIWKSIYCFTPLMSDVLNWMICCLVPKMNTCWIGELYKHIELESGWFFLHQVLGNAGPLSVLSILNV